MNTSKCTLKNMKAQIKIYKTSLVMEEIKSNYVVKEADPRRFYS